ncbi:MAG: site-specific integrase [Candidatus Hydrogenedentes bacterium]|nr:site-specific integrase [Candidatus Hydrogenedentota bacterium]
MATITRRKTGYQAQVRRKGYPTVSRSFDTRKDAEKWARQVEGELDRGIFIDRSEADKNTLGDILKRYLAEINPSKKGAVCDAIRINRLLRDKICTLKLSALSGKALSQWRDERLKAVTGATVNRELTIISAAINIARKEWGVHVENPVSLIRRPEGNRPRTRRLSQEEEAHLLHACTATERDRGRYTGPSNVWIKPLVLVALETAMRRGELLSLLWSNIDLTNRVARLEDTKNGERRDVPLSTRAVAILRDLPRTLDGKVFPITDDSLKKGFVRAVQRARESYELECMERGTNPAIGFLTDLHFHDLRHEATSRLAERLSNILELSAVTGHKDLRMLKRYYHPRAEDLAKKLG